VNVILDSLGVAEETPSAWEGAEEPRPIDVRVLETDYALNPGDVVRIFIFELLRDGELFANDYTITESGKVSIPEVGVITAAGLTESQLEEEIRDIVEPSLLKKPSITVSLVRSERRTVSILGNGVRNPSRYVIPRHDFRLADAIAGAGGISEFNVSNIYVSRPVTGREVELAPQVEPSGVGGPGKPKEELVVPEEEMLEILAPRAAEPSSGDKLVVASSEMTRDRETGSSIFSDRLERFAGRERGAAYSAAYRRKVSRQQVMAAGGYQRTGTEDVVFSSGPGKGGETAGEPSEERDDRIEWIFQDGRWVPVRVGPPKPPEPEIEVEPEEVAPPVRERVPPELGWDEIGAAGVQTRVIKIPVDKFQAGDPRYNIAIRPGDTVYVPVDIIGEFYIMGNTVRQGAVNLTGRPMTLKMAIAAAGGLGEYAWPKRCEVIRRLPNDREEIVMVDLDKIARGEQPDFYIKPDDLINVGTHPTARWRFILRNAFRATYGFGFLYDRNFADADFGKGFRLPHWL
jgi:polysaccharide export outer membrane protein